MLFPYLAAAGPVPFGIGGFGGVAIKGLGGGAVPARAFGPPCGAESIPGKGGSRGVNCDILSNISIVSTSPIWSGIIVILTPHVGKSLLGQQQPKRRRKRLAPRKVAVQSSC